METNAPEVTIELILSTFSRKTEEKKLKEIKSSIVNQLIPDSAELFDGRQETIEREIDELIRADKKTGRCFNSRIQQGKVQTEEK